MAFWKRWFKGEVDPVPGLLLEGLRREWPDLAFEHLPELDVIEIRGADGGEPLLRMGLATVRQWAGGQGAAGAVAAWLLDPQVRNGIDHARDGGARPPFDVAGLVPRFALAERFAAIPEPIVHREAWPGVWLTICWHHEAFGAHYLGDDDLAALGLPWDAALQRATENLDGLWRGKLQIAAVPAPGGGAELLVVDDVHAASGLLLPSFRERISRELGTPFLAMAPQTDELVAAPALPRDRAEGHFRTARQSFRDSAHPVSDRILVVRPEGWEAEEAGSA